MDLFKEIIHNFSTDIKTRLYECIHESIHSKNKEVVEFILQDRKPKGKELIEAIRTDDVELVELILKYNSDPTFINQIDDSGPGLCIAAEQQNLEIVRCLLKVRGIDANLCNYRNLNSLRIAIGNYDLEIIDVILDFYRNTDEQAVMHGLLQSTTNLCLCIYNYSIPNIIWEIFKHLIKFRYLQINIFQQINNSFRSIARPLLVFACDYSKNDFIESLLKMDSNFNVNEIDGFKRNTLVVNIRLCHFFGSPSGPLNVPGLMH